MRRSLQHFISVAIFFIVLAAFFYVVPLYTDRFTSAGIVKTTSEEYVATFLVEGELHEGKINEYLIVNGKTAKIIDVNDERAVLELRDNNQIITVALRVNETTVLRGISVQLVRIG